MLDNAGNRTSTRRRLRRRDTRRTTRWNASRRSRAPAARSPTCTTRRAMSPSGRTQTERSSITPTTPQPAGDRHKRRQDHRLRLRRRVQRHHDDAARRERLCRNPQLRQRRTADSSQAPEGRRRARRHRLDPRPGRQPAHRDPHRHLAGLEDLHVRQHGPLTGVCFQTGTCPGGADPFIRWDYDGVGNRLSEQRPAGTTSYTYDQMDRMLTAGSTSYSYDRNGNQLTAGSRSFTWDLANRLRPRPRLARRRPTATTGTASVCRPRPGTATTEDELHLGRHQGYRSSFSSARGNNSLIRRYVNGHQPIFMSHELEQRVLLPHGPARLRTQRHRRRRRNTAHLRLRALRAVRTQSGTLTNPSGTRGSTTIQPVCTT